MQYYILHIISSLSLAIINLQIIRMIREQDLKNLISSMETVNPVQMFS